MSWPQNEIFSESEWNNMLSPVDYEFEYPTPIDTSDTPNTPEALHQEFLKAFLDLELTVNPSEKPLTDEEREKYLKELETLYPMPSENVPIERQWWLRLPSYQESTAPNGYICNPGDKDSLCSLRICPVCCPEVLESPSDLFDFTSVESFGVDIEKKPIPSEELLPPLDDAFNWIEQFS